MGRGGGEILGEMFSGVQDRWGKDGDLFIP